MDKIISESQLNERIGQIYQEERYKVIEEKWSRLSKTDKQLVVEMLKVIYPEKAKLVTEAKWYNTVGDIVVIIDPTGVVDLINGVSYWRQGDKLFALLSWISVIPFLGDAIAKPIAGLFKMGGGSAKAFKAASLAGDAVKMAEIAKNTGPLGKLLGSVTKWGGKVLEPLGKAVGKVPGIGKGMVKGVEDFIKLFKDANGVMKTGAKEAIELTAKKAAKGLTAVEAKTLEKALKTATEFRGFRGFKGATGWKGGVGRLWGNRATRGLMRNTKWYLGLLTFLGIGNFVGPDELEKEVDNLEDKVNQYSQTPESEKLFTQDMEQSGITLSEPTQDESDIWKKASQGITLSEPTQDESDIWKRASQGMGIPGSETITTPNTTTPKSIKSDDIFGGLFA